MAQKQDLPLACKLRSRGDAAYDSMLLESFEEIFLRNRSAPDGGVDVRGHADPGSLFNSGLEEPLTEEMPSRVEPFVFPSAYCVFGQGPAVKATSDRRQVESASDGLLGLRSALLLLLADSRLGGTLIRYPQTEVFGVHAAEYNRTPRDPGYNPLAPMSNAYFAT